MNDNQWIHVGVQTTKQFISLNYSVIDIYKYVV